MEKSPFYFKKQISYFYDCVLTSNVYYPKHHGQETRSCVYVVRQKHKKVSTLRLWCYTFANPLDATSIQLKKSACYNLIAQ